MKHLQETKWVGLNFTSLHAEFKCNTGEMSVEISIRQIYVYPKMALMA